MSRKIRIGLDAHLRLAVAEERGTEVFQYRRTNWPLTCLHQLVQNRTDPRTASQWIRYMVVAVIALFLVWWMLRLYVL